MAARNLRVVISGDSASLNRALQTSGVQLDRFGAQARASSGHVAGFAAATEASGKRIATAGTRISSFGHAMSRVALPVAALGAVTIKMAADFQKSMELVHTQAGASQKEVDNLSKQVLKLAPQVGTVPKELAKGLFHIESVGQRGAKAMNTLRIAAEGAKIGGSDLESTTNALTGAMKTNIGGAHGAKEAMAALNAVVGAGNLRMQDLTGALSTGVLPAAKAFGLQFKDVGAALDVMTARGVPAEAAATRLRMTFSLMAAPTSKAVTALQSIGLTSTKLATDMRSSGGLPSAVLDLKKHLDSSGLSATKQAQVISHAFGGGRTSSGILTLVQNADELKKKFDLIGKADGAKKFNEAWKKTEQTTAEKFAKMKAEAAAAAIKMGAALAPVVIPVLEKIATDVGKVATAFQKLPAPVRKGVVEFAAFGAIIGLIAVPIGAVVRGVGLLFSGFGALVRVGPRVAGLFRGAGAAAGEGAAGARLFGASLGRIVPIAAVVLGAVHGIKNVVDKGFFGGAIQNLKDSQLALNPLTRGLHELYVHSGLVHHAFKQISNDALLLTGNMKILGTATLKPTAALGRLGDRFPPIRTGINSVIGAVAGMSRSMSLAAGAGVQRLVSGLDKLVGKLTTFQTAASSAAGAIGNIGTQVGQALPHGRAGGRFQSGGLVPAMLSPGELGVLPDGNQFMVPGRPEPRDSVFMPLPSGTEIFTGSGQAMLAAGVPREQALQAQMPHFAKGGWVKTGFTVDAGSDPKQTYNNGMSFAELLQAGTNRGEHPNLTELLGLKDTTGYGMGYPQFGQKATPILVRAGAGHPAYTIVKSDVGSGQGSKAYTIDLHGAIANKIHRGGKGFLEVARIGTATSGGTGGTPGTPGVPAHLQGSNVVTHPDLRQLFGTATSTGLEAGAAAGAAGDPLFHNYAGMNTSFFDSLLGGVTAPSVVAATRGTPARPGTSGGGVGSGKYHFPLQNFGSEGRVDRGQDMEAASGYSNTVAIGDGLIVNSGLGFPGMQLRLSSGPLAGHTAFYAHNAAALVGSGKHVRAGTPIGRTGGAPFAGATHTEIGFMEGYGSQSGHWVGPGSQGGNMMHSLLHKLAPNRIHARTGGVVGFRKGGKAHHKVLSPINRLLAGIGGAGNSAVSSARGDLIKLAALVDNPRTPYNTLLSGEHRIEAQIGKLNRHGLTARERVQVGRLSAALQTISAEVGYRITEPIGRTDLTLSGLDRQSSRMGNEMILAGIDPTSAEGVAQLDRFDAGATGILQSRRAQLETARRRAVRTHDPKLLAQVNAQIATVDDAILQHKVDVKQRDDQLKATVDNTAALQQTADLLKQQVAHLQDVALRLTAESSTFARALADFVSGQIVGQGVQPRAMTAGFGTAASY